MEPPPGLLVVSANPLRVVATHTEAELQEMLCIPPLPPSVTCVHALDPPAGSVETNASFERLRPSIPTATQSVTEGHDTAAGANMAIGGRGGGVQKLPPGVGPVGGGHEGGAGDHTGCHEPAPARGVVETSRPDPPATTHRDVEAHETD